MVSGVFIIIPSSHFQPFWCLLCSDRQVLVKSQIPASVQSWYQITASALSKKAESAARKSKSIQRLQQKYPKLDGVRVVASFVEAKIVRLFFKPITVPGRIWMSWRLTKWCKRCWDIRRAGDEECGNFEEVEELARRNGDASPVRKNMNA